MNIRNYCESNNFFVGEAYMRPLHTCVYLEMYLPKPQLGHLITKAGASGHIRSQAEEAVSQCSGAIYRTLYILSDESDRYNILW